jgi:hypothetical protein
VSLDRRVLQVGVDRDHVLAPGPAEAGRLRGLMTTVAEQTDHAQLSPVLRSREQQRRGLVPAAVVDHDQLVGDAESVQQRPHPREEHRQHLLLVVHRYDDGERRLIGSHTPGPY